MSHVWHIFLECLNTNQSGVWDLESAINMQIAFINPCISKLSNVQCAEMNTNLNVDQYQSCILIFRFIFTHLDDKNKRLLKLVLLSNLMNSPIRRTQLPEQGELGTGCKIIITRTREMKPCGLKFYNSRCLFLEL